MVCPKIAPVEPTLKFGVRPSACKRAAPFLISSAGLRAGSFNFRLTDAVLESARSPGGAWCQQRPESEKQPARRPALREKNRRSDGRASPLPATRDRQRFRWRLFDGKLIPARAGAQSPAPGGKNRGQRSFAADHRRHPRRFSRGHRPSDGAGQDGAPAWTSDRAFDPHRLGRNGRRALRVGCGQRGRGWRPVAVFLSWRRLRVLQSVRRTCSTPS